MKNILFKISASVIMGLFAISCETDFTNINSASDDQVFSTREGLFAVTIGMKQIYATTGLRFIIETPAITTREGGITTTFINMQELEDGGQALPNFNTNVQGLWTAMLRVMKISEDIQNNIDQVALEPGTRSGLIAYAKLFKAMAIGSLSQNYQQVVVNTSANNDAEFVSRIEGYGEAIRLLNEARTEIQEQATSNDFNSSILGNEINLLNTVNAMLARYNLFAGNYDAAIAATNNVNLNEPSAFIYDNLNLNPIYLRVIQGGAPNFKPRDNFGLPGSFTIDPTDGRIPFYLIPSDQVNQNGLPVEDLAGFFDVSTEPIPVYLPDEIRLIRAEANLRKTNTDIASAISEINAVRTDNDDIFGVNANLGTYAGPETAEALLLEVYQNRRIELFLTGLSLEDSRRFQRPEPSTSSGNYNEERNRNFYPYPEIERNNNPNTPSDPSI